VWNYLDVIEIIRRTRQAVVEGGDKSAEAMERNLVRYLAVKTLDKHAPRTRYLRPRSGAHRPSSQ